MANDLKILGLDFIEYSSPKPDPLRGLFADMGFSPRLKHGKDPIEVWTQNRIHFLLNEKPNSFASAFHEAHGPSVCSMGWLVEDAEFTYNEAIKRGAKPAPTKDLDTPAILGIGGSLIYFVDGENQSYFQRMGFEGKADTNHKGLGFEFIDHLTHNVPKGDMQNWVDFYKGIFGFEEIRYFDIKGKKTGLTSFALRSPSLNFSIPINEGTEEKSQINEYLREYNGAGIQHIALSTENILDSVGALAKTSLETLDIEDAYYDEVWDRVPNVSEDKERIKKLQILADGDEDGYLLQIFTKNCIGPIFFEFIQRRNHHAFGEGNFGALFRSIERDQERRGVL